jgi:hypothetical protein
MLLEQSATERVQRLNQPAQADDEKVKMKVEIIAALGQKKNPHAEWGELAAVRMNLSMM